MKKDMNRTKNLLADFSRSRDLIRTPINKDIKKKGRNLVKSNKKTKQNYVAYKAKLERGDIESLSSKDILEFFKDTARDNDIKYVDSKPVISMRNFNLAKERGYSVEEILVMIEFLYESEQDYLDKRTLHPGILLTGWCNKIYTDSQMWLKDEYQTDIKKKHSSREWSEEIPKEDSVEIGEWE